MCARFGLIVSPHQFQFLFGTELQSDLARDDLRPTDQAEIITTLGSAEPMRWGLIPSWADDPKVGVRAFNARSETVTEKPTFREPFKRSRCLVPASHFFEWSEKQKIKITVQGQPLIAFAGLYDQWNGINSFTIITTEAQGRMAEIHDRMPLILPQERFEEWLTGPSPESLLHPIVHPFEFDPEPSGPQQASLF